MKSKRETKERRENRLRLARLHRLQKNRIPKRKNWNDIVCALGYVDSYGAVHGKIITDSLNREFVNSVCHYTHYPNATCYKAWRWWKHSGLEGSCLNKVEPDGEDWVAIRRWLYKKGLLEDWELDEDLL